MHQILAVQPFSIDLAQRVDIEGSNTPTLRSGNRVLDRSGHVVGILFVGQILFAINDISAGLTGLVGNVRQAASMVTDGTREIADGNMVLATRTERQAGEVNAAASAMHELTVKVSENADRANQLNGLVASLSTRPFTPPMLTVT